MRKLATARIKQTTLRSGIANTTQIAKKQPISNSSIERLKSVSKDGLTGSGKLSSSSQNLGNSRLKDAIISGSLDKSKIGNGTISVGMWEPYQRPDPEQAWSHTKVVVGLGLLGAGFLAGGGEAGAAIFAADVIWTAASMGIDAYRGDVGWDDIAAMSANKAGSYIDMIGATIPGPAGSIIEVTGKAVSIAGAAIDANDDLGGNSIFDSSEEGTGETHETSGNGQAGSDSDSDDGNDDESNETCTENEGAGTTSDSSESSSDSTSEEGGGTDNPMDDGPASPYVLTKNGWEIAEYDGDGRSNNKASSRNTLGNWGESNSSSSYVMPGTRQDYDVITRAGGGHTDPGDSDLWSTQSYFLDPISVEAAVFKTNGGGTKCPSPLSHDSVISYQSSDDDGPHNPEVGGNENDNDSSNGLLDILGGAVGPGLGGSANSIAQFNSLNSGLVGSGLAFESVVLGINSVF